MHSNILGAILIAIFLGKATPVKIVLEDNAINLNPTGNGIDLEVISKGEVKLSGTLALGENFTTANCVGAPTCQIGDSTLSVTTVTDGIRITWETKNNATVFQDCFNLKEGVNWYGGPQRRVQSWPIEKINIDGTLPYVSRRDDNFGVAERYWLNSKGVYIYLSELVPLFVDQSANQIVCFNAKPVAPYINRNRNILDYHIIIKDDPREAHLHAINNFLGKPTGHPDARMIAEPIWTTWAKYKKDINDATVLEFAQEIRKQGYENGQLEIDDQWETCYGAQKFNPEKFSDINNTVSKLKKDNFRVTLWVHPFVNSDCQNNSDVGSENGYFVKNVNGSTSGSWWDGTDAHQIDFTNEAAAEWWKARLELLQNDPKIDSYKFDAGETDYSPQPAVYLVAENNTEKLPNWLTESYVRTCAEFGTLIEVRSGSRTQDLPIFVRMLDKDSVWDEDNGLPTLITTLLQLNMNGYTMVLPDMIGGNGYGGHMPRAEMIVRWTQANAFMPAMQFSYLPWEFNSTRFDAPAIVKKFVDLHKNYSNVIIEAMEECVRSGAPVNPPIWWIDPTDSTALACDDEFLVGEKILVAPIIKEGVRERNVYLPKGEWRDANSKITEYTGPIHFKYEADIDILPYFIKV